MARNKRRPGASESLLERGDNPKHADSHHPENPFEYEHSKRQDTRSSAASNVTRVMENFAGPRGRVTARLKEVIMKPNPMALKKRAALVKKNKAVKKQNENPYYEDNPPNRNSPHGKYKQTQHKRRHDDYSSDGSTNDASYSRSISSDYDSYTDDYSTSLDSRPVFNRNDRSRGAHISDRELPGTGKGQLAQPEEEEAKVYIVQQRFGVFAIVLGWMQILILFAMVYRCGGFAPMFNPMINPMIGPYPDVLSSWGAKNTYLIINGGEWWRLFTPIMLHAGVIHIVGNVGIQMEHGVLFEREWGSLIWIIIYVVSGAGGNLLSAIFMPNSLSVGSSGSVCGLFGAKLAEVLCRVCETTDTGQKKLAYRVRSDQCKEALCTVFIIAAFSMIPLVDWASHLGGGLGGLLIGFALFGPGCYYCVFAIFLTLAGWGLSIFLFSYGLKYLYTQVEADEALGDYCTYFQDFVEDYECVCQTLSSFFGDDDDGYND